MRAPALVPAVLLLALAASGAQPPGAGRAAPAPDGGGRRLVPDLGLGSLGAIPKGEGLTASEAGGLAPATRTLGDEGRYELVGVAHARGFVTAGGASRPRAGGALERVALLGRPPRLEAFSTVVRVRSAARRGGPIEVVVLDPRGDTVMSASGTLSFAASRGDVAEYLVDWAATACRGPGAFQVLVRVAGQPLGTAPLAVVPEGS